MIRLQQLKLNENRYIEEYYKYDKNGDWDIDWNQGNGGGRYNAYTIHSFNEQVIGLKKGGAAFLDLGDAYERGMTVHINKAVQNGSGIRYGSNEFVPFHFYGDTGDNNMSVQLGGIGEVSTGIVIAGASGRSLKTLNSNKQVFLQIIDPDTGESVIKGKSRTGTSGGESVTDTVINRPSVTPCHYL